MKLIAAAIKYFIHDTDDEFIDLVLTGQRHSEIRDKAHERHYDKYENIEGFLTDNCEFVNRWTAKQIAVAANQLIVPLEETYPELYSEDIW